MPTSDNNFVTAIIVSHNGALWLPEVVASLAKQRRAIDQIIAIDTGSEDSSVKSFEEKPQSEGWINAGYFIFEPQVFDYLESNSILEREPLTKLARDGQLMAYKHEGFFQPMDTLREMMMLNEMWDPNKAPWKVWK